MAEQSSRVNRVDDNQDGVAEVLTPTEARCEPTECGQILRLPQSHPSKHHQSQTGNDATAEPASEAPVTLCGPILDPSLRHLTVDAFGATKQPA
ncbi:unnamed protein product [Protopolystoma xenopodis]|uniref:Uncharacterized protein n=1 Tax=Protopolystoma xenopodis TaxID=117903 RepID=A0A448WDG3_9PLAT|nr:unnamed protein product [Protopolystoma xenopodis]